MSQRNKTTRNFIDKYSKTWLTLDIVGSIYITTYKYNPLLEYSGDRYYNNLVWRPTTALTSKTTYGFKQLG